MAEASDGYKTWHNPNTVQFLTCACIRCFCAKLRAVVASHKTITEGSFEAFVWMVHVQASGVSRANNHISAEYEVYAK